MRRDRTENRVTRITGSGVSVAVGAKSEPRSDSSPVDEAIAVFQESPKVIRQGEAEARLGVEQRFIRARWLRLDREASERPTQSVIDGH